MKKKTKSKPKKRSTAKKRPAKKKAPARKAAAKKRAAPKKTTARKKAVKKPAKKKAAARKKAAPKKTTARKKAVKKPAKKKATARKKAATRKPATRKRATAKKTTVRKKGTAKKAGRARLRVVKSTPGARGRAASRRRGKKAIRPIDLVPPRAESLTDQLTESSANVLKVYERGMKAFRKEQWSKAAKVFQQILDQFPNALEIGDRARMYLERCESHLPRRTKGQNGQDLTLKAVFEINNGAYDQAIALLSQAPARLQRDPYVKYLLASAYAHKGDVKQALAHLKKAMAKDKLYENYALRFPEFAAVVATPEFQALLEK